MNDKDYVMSPREKVWYDKEVNLIHEKFGDEITPLPIRIYRRKNARFTGRIHYDSFIELHNKYGTTRHTLLHELTHAYLYKRYADVGYKRPHRQEFKDLLNYLFHGGTTKGFYERIVKQEQKVVMKKVEKKNPDYKIEKAEALLKKWYAKRKRADTAIKKLEKKIRRLRKCLMM